MDSTNFDRMQGVTNMNTSLKKIEFPNEPAKLGYSSLEFYAALSGSPRSYSRWIRRNITDNPMVQEGRDFAISRRLNGKIEGKGTCDYVLSQDLTHGIAMKHPGAEGDAVRAFFAAALKAAQAPALPASTMEGILSAVHALVSTVKDMMAMQDRRVTALEERTILALPAPVEALPAADMSLRAQLSEVMAAWGHENSSRYGEGWRALYVKYKRVFGEDLVARAKNIPKKTLDYAEENGRMAKLLSVAKTYFAVAPRGQKEA